MTDKQSETLVTAPDLTRVKILQISAGRSAINKLQQLAIFPGIELKVVRHAPIGGPVLVAVAGREIAIGRKLAGKVEVEVLR